MDCKENQNNLPLYCRILSSYKCILNQLSKASKMGVGSKRSRIIWKVSFLASIWMILKEKNVWCFEGKSFNGQILEDKNKLGISISTIMRWHFHLLLNFALPLCGLSLLRAFWNKILMAALEIIRAGSCGWNYSGLIWLQHPILLRPRSPSHTSAFRLLEDLSEWVAPFQGREASLDHWSNKGKCRTA